MSRKDNFRLQPILNYKTGLVDNLETEFAQLRNIEKNEEETLLHLESVERDHAASLAEQQRSKTINPHTIGLHQKYLQYLQNHVDRQMVRVAEAKNNTENKRQELVKMMQDQKTLEKLKEKHVTRTNIEINRKEGRILDDLVTTRYTREGYSHA